MLNRHEAYELLEKVKPGHVLLIKEGTYFQETPEFNTTIQFNDKRLILINSVEKEPPPKNTYKWTRFTMEAKDLKTGKKFTFSCARGDFVVEHYKDGNKKVWELLFGN